MQSKIKDIIRAVIFTVGFVAFSMVMHQFIIPESRLWITIIIVSAIGLIYILVECGKARRSAGLYDVMFGLTNEEHPSTIFKWIRNIDISSLRYRRKKYVVFYLKNQLVPNDNLGGVPQRCEYILDNIGTYLPRHSEDYDFIMECLTEFISNYPVEDTCHEKEKEILKKWSAIYVDSVSIVKDSGKEFRRYIRSIAYYHLTRYTKIESFIYLIQQRFDEKMLAEENSFCNSEELKQRFLEEKEKVTKECLASEAINY